MKFLLSCLALSTCIASGCLERRFHQAQIQEDVLNRGLRDSAGMGCGEPVAAAFKPPAATGFDWLRQLEEISNRNAADLRATWGPMTPEEEAVVAKAKASPPPAVHRAQEENLRGLLGIGRIASAAALRRLAPQNLPRVVTPQLEDSLFGAYDCVFITLGQPLGLPKYGDVAIVLSDEIHSSRQAWATKSSGWHFLVKHLGHGDDALGERLAVEIKHNLTLLTNEHRQSYSRGILVAKDWKDGMISRLLDRIRKTREPDRTQLVRDLLAAPSPEAFWDRVSFDRWVELEGKIGGEIPLSAVRAIYVGRDRLNEVRTWPEAQPWLHLIRPFP